MRDENRLGRRAGEAGVSSGVTCSLHLPVSKSFDGSQVVGRGQVGVRHTHLDSLVAHQFRDCRDVDSGHRKSAGKRMTQTVPRNL